MSAIQEKASELQDYLVKTRRYLHENPESSLKEYETAAFIQKELDSFGVPFEKVGETGTLAIIKGEKGEGKTVLLRADIDALELPDCTGKPYASKRLGLNHACGHDAHTAMGLGTAKLLNDIKDTFSGIVKIAFQPAEEIGAGAKQFVTSGQIDDMDESFAIHVNSGLPVGSFAVQGGPVNASCDIFKIKITGKSAHVGRPHLGHDALVTASEVVVALQTIVAREVNPIDRAVVGIGKLNAGTRYNIVANDAEIEGTIRAFSHETRAHLKEAVTRIAKGIAELNRCEFEIEWYDAAAPVINTLELAEEFQKVVSKVEGIDNLITNYESSMGADDFADYLVNKPGVYGLLGSQSGEETAYGHHHEKFDIDERVLALGVEIEVNYFLSRLA
ncbi:M20 family metallopeptidase [uncultured Granulicatella sp.]|uniref:M20 metallopeptidase family protein n=1 Tax=uncultured Granulicatella sp. TaxID=316089 RepID=UPI00262AAA4B|nr:amidohydrolase [uncultured Granulicatella sp.]